MVEPEEVRRTRPVTSSPLTAMGRAPNSPSVDGFARPLYAWMTYWPGGTLGNSNEPLGSNRAPTATLVPNTDCWLGTRSTLAAVVGSPAELTALPATSAVGTRESENSRPTNSCEGPTSTNCASLEFGVPGK